MSSWPPKTGPEVDLTIYDVPADVEASGAGKICKIDFTVVRETETMGRSLGVRGWPPAAKVEVGLAECVVPTTGKAAVREVVCLGITVSGVFTGNGGIWLIGTGGVAVLRACIVVGFGIRFDTG